MTKNEIRALIKNLKANISNKQKEIDAKAVTSIIERSLWFKKSTHVLTYHSLPDEISTSLHFNWNKHKSIYLPRVNGDLLEVLPFGETQIGSFKIQEPTNDNIINPQSLELIIVPGVAFDFNGTRIGRGKGFYDKLLSNTNALKIGIGYDFQLLENIPHEPHDILMDAIITPNHQVILNTKLAWC